MPLDTNLTNLHRGDQEQAGLHGAVFFSAVFARNGRQKGDGVEAFRSVIAQLKLFLTGALDAICSAMVVATGKTPSRLSALCHRAMWNMFTQDLASIGNREVDTDRAMTL